MIVKIVHNVLITGSKLSTENFLAQVQSEHELGTVVYGPSHFLFFGIQTEIGFDTTVMINRDAKLQTISSSLLSRH